MATIEEITSATTLYAEARKALNVLCDGLMDKINLAKRDALPAIRVAADDVAESLAILRELIEKSPDLFEKPKTKVFENIRIGFKKQPGRIEIGDEAAVIERIKELHPDKVAMLIKTEEKVLKAGLDFLTAKELKALGVTVTSDDNVVVIKATGTDVEKLAADMVKDGEKILGDAA